jgi:uncharacterized protein YbaP (TraB family)
MMIQSTRKYLLVALALILSPDLPAGEVQCRPYKLVDVEVVQPEKFGEGLLWEVRHDGIEPAYIYGTIHVDDADILDLPEPVRTSLEQSRSFVMEMLPAVEDIAKFSSAMFFTDGTRLDQLVPEDIYNRMVTILGASSNLTAEVIPLLKPWAAFIIMSYPANMDMVLDLKLLELAQQNQASVSALETVEEQIAIFNELEVQDQIRILADSVCHYDDTGQDFDKMKSLYTDQDLQGLVTYSQRYRFDDNAVYDRVYARLIDLRNRRMVERMGAVLAGGRAFIAVGAMHLPGEGGILNLLERQGYIITRIY